MNKPMKFWSVRRILTTVAGAPWAYLVWSGYDLCYGPYAHSVTGPPNKGQVILYVIVPATGLLVALALIVLANKIPLWIEWIAFGIHLLALIFVLMMWGGGM
jgi:hypothetical protein